MAIMDWLLEKWKEFFGIFETEDSQPLTTWGRIKRVIGVGAMCLYRLRKVFLAIPVIHYALKLASYNSEHLPEEVGFNFLATGEYASYISRNMAVMGPLMVTVSCLVLMFVSRKALYPWAISLFTLILPLLLLISNLYPA